MDGLFRAATKAASWRAIPKPIKRLKRQYPAAWDDGRAEGATEVRAFFAGKRGPVAPMRLAPGSTKRQWWFEKGTTFAEDARQRRYWEQMKSIPIGAIDENELEVFMWGFINAWGQFLMDNTDLEPKPPPPKPHSPGA
jgi:hypothetical protein